MTHHGARTLDHEQHVYDERLGAGHQRHGRLGYQVLTLNDRRDLTFNQLLGINNEGVIVGYFGSGADANHPNKGYELLPPFAQGDFGNRNFPGSAQTQVTGLNDTGVTVGFFSTTNAAVVTDNNNIGFWQEGRPVPLGPLPDAE